MTADGIGDDRLGGSGDAFYELLMAAHDGLTFDQSTRLNARLVLILANRVGDRQALTEALAAARQHITDDSQTQDTQEE